MADAIVRLLLVGWNAPLGGRGLAGLPASEQAEVRALFAGAPDSVETLWLAHEAWLRQEAERLQLPRRYRFGAERVFFAERLARLRAERRIRKATTP